MPRDRSLQAKCPQCCPDHVVDFEPWGWTEKRCINCHHVLPVRRITPSGKSTVSQERVVDRILSVFGGSVVRREVMGRKLWIEIHNPARSWVSGDTVFGAIGVGGKMELKMHRLGADVVITSDNDINSHLKDSATRLAELRESIATIEGSLNGGGAK